MGCLFVGPQHGKRNGKWTSKPAQFCFILVHQLDQHYTSSNQHKPDWTNMEFMLVYAGVFSRVVVKTDIQAIIKTNLKGELVTLYNKGRNVFMFLKKHHSIY